jgi:hypothetical protein
MLCQLTLMDCEDYIRPDPKRLFHGSLGEFLEDVSVFSHHSFRSFHLTREIGIVGSQLDTIRRLDDIERIAFVDAKPLQYFFWEYNAGGVSHCRDLQCTHGINLT